MTDADLAEDNPHGERQMRGHSQYNTKALLTAAIAKYVTPATIATFGVSYYFSRSVVFASLLTVVMSSVLVVGVAVLVEEAQHRERMKVH